MSDEELSIRTFCSLGIKKWLAENAFKLGLCEATTVQKACIPPILKGLDVIGTSQTGSGKTATFALPILHILSQDSYGIFALCMTPTRELAVQISEQFSALSAGLTLRCQVITGGEEIQAQTRSILRRPHIIVATPGRLMDHFLNSPQVIGCFQNLRFLVLDEADRLLEPSFESELRILFENIPSKRQTLLFSASITRNIAALQHITMNDAFHFEAFEGLKAVSSCRQEYCFLPRVMRDAYLLHILQQRENWDIRSSIIFTSTVRSCMILSGILDKLGIVTVSLHSMKKQKERKDSFARFKSGEVSILLATDIASRGLDIPTVDMVINYEVPIASKDYIHRIGRTARAGRSGRSITLVTQHDVKIVQKIEDAIDSKMRCLSLPEEEIVKNMNSVGSARRSVKISLLERTGFGEKVNKNHMK
ncbi:ATP-dependent RNA helicase DBP8 [Bathycoccus prasinos]|uniref:ATP-dependent RNA helicase DBP8 n=1 Tax=Bathycoccus prasinos TaxID=41875 RepID=K8ENN0_9CHLO|nr:ATP-dependent RNA helicase DBP8 [Bathycoccus prasinos]CCO19569.1 ATP-dependent RNA helicase DBP8 [Bathycoccus prasinos]|eukprot:XP_007509112.1 ATP-dependent RNA helicase DBP8 [Bathycoccus prasinos]